MDGEITAVGWGGAGGYTISVKSTDGQYRFSYSHCSPEFIVSVGQEVKKGEIIGKVGSKNVYGVTNNPYKDRPEPWEKCPESDPSGREYP